MSSCSQAFFSAITDQLLTVIGIRIKPLDTKNASDVISGIFYWSEMR